MKKLLIGVLAVACCIAFSVPVFAEIRVGGMISAEQYYYVASKERFISGGVSRTDQNQMLLGGAQGNSGLNGLGQSTYTSTEFGMGQPWNRLNVQYISDDKKIGGFIEIRTGGQRGGGNSISAPVASAAGLTNGTAGSWYNRAYANPTGEQNFDWELAYIDWHFNPNFYLRVGRQTQTFAIYSPEQQMGHNQGHIVLAGFGNIHGATSRDAIRAYVKFNDTVRMEVQAIAPNSIGAQTPTGIQPGAIGRLSTAQFTGLGTNVFNTSGGIVTMPALLGAYGNIPREGNTIPRMDLSIPIKFANFNIEPSFTYQGIRYSDVATDSAKGFTVWGSAVGFKAGFGPITWSGEYTYGVNMGGSSLYVGAQPYSSPVTQPGRLTTNGLAGGVNSVALTDTKEHAAWTQLEYNFGPFAVQGIVGFDKSYNDANSTLAKEVNYGYFNSERWAYGFQVPFNIAKNMKVVPQFWYYDFGGHNSFGGRAGDVSNGYEVTSGLFWQLSF